MRLVACSVHRCRTLSRVAVVLGIAGAFIGSFAPSLAYAESTVHSDKPNAIEFTPQQAKFIRFIVEASADGSQPCIDELEVYGGDAAHNLALASEGAKATASSCLPGYAAHQIEHINDGRYGNDRSWVAATGGEEWAQIELPQPAEISRVVFSRDRNRYFADRMPVDFAIQLSLDGSTWKTVSEVNATAAEVKLRQRGASGFSGDVPSPPPPPQRAQDGTIVFAGAPQTLAAAKKDERGFANLALNPAAKPNASSFLPGYAIHQVANLNDGFLGNDHSWVSNADPSWAEIDLGDVFCVYQVAFGSDSSSAHNDRSAIAFSILTATEYAPETNAPNWKPAHVQTDGAAVLSRTAFSFAPVQARWVRIAVEKTNGGQVRIDEIEVFGQKDPIAPEAIGPIGQPAQGPTLASHVKPIDENELKLAFLGEEHAWLKTYGRADLSPRLVPYNGRVKEYPRHVGDDVLPLPPLSSESKLDGVMEDPCWNEASRGVARVASPYDFAAGPLVEHVVIAGWRGTDLYLAFDFDRLLSGHIAVISTTDGQGCGVLVYTDKGLVFKQYEGNTEKTVTPVEGACNESLTRCEVRLPLDLFPACRDLGLRIGLGMGGQHTDKSGRPVYFAFSSLGIAQAGPCADGAFPVRFTLANTLPSRTEGAIRVSGNVAELQNGVVLSPGESRVVSVAADAKDIGPSFNLEVSDDRGQDYALHLFRYDPLERTLTLMNEMLTRFAVKGLDAAKEREQLNGFRQRQQALVALPTKDLAAERAAFFDARMAKRALFMREPDLAPMEDLLFAKRMPFEPSHNYSVVLDAPFRPGGAIATLHIPRDSERFLPEQAEVNHLFESGGGIARTPAATYDLAKIYFAYRPSEPGYFHIMRMNADGSGLTQITDGPFHDFWPCPLPDGDLAVISTRCHMRFLCWRPQAFVMFRMTPDGQDFQPLSYANLSEWAPSVMQDGRIIWTRSEYQDKAADFGHTLWSIRPDGRQPELIFGNDIIQPNGYANGREVPGTHEICCTLISHFGDLNGPIALLDIDKGRFNPQAITSLTPEVPWPGMWPAEECFRDAYPIARDYFLCSHAPAYRFELFVLDRYGNRELLYGDPEISCMCPTVFKAQTPPPIIAPDTKTPALIAEDSGEFVMRDVYAGISPPVQRGQVKYIRVCEEVRANLEIMPDGEYRKDHDPEFLDWYATPVHKVSGPYGWTTYVAKAPHGLVPVEEDGSAHFRAPAGKVLYFEALDENFNELQRMRSVVQLQPGEKRSCIGCHEQRQFAPPNARRLMAKGPVEPLLAEWEGVPFSYEKVVQPVLDKHCVQCHNENHKMGLDLRGTLDNDKVPVSYRTLVSNGFVHYADMQWNAGGCEKFQPLSLGTLKSKLWDVLNAGHHEVQLTPDDMLRVKTWIDLNCPLWPDYINRLQRPGPEAKVASVEGPRN